jgi:hypothetical protein
MPVFSSIQANNASNGCRTRATTVDNHWSWGSRQDCPFCFFNGCQDGQILSLPDVFRVGPSISFIAIQFIAVQLWPNLIKYLAIMVSSRRARQCTQESAMSQVGGAL